MNMPQVGLFDLNVDGERRTQVGGTELGLRGISLMELKMVDSLVVGVCEWGEDASCGFNVVSK